MYSICALKPPYEWRLESPSQQYDPLPNCYSADLRRITSSCLSFRPEHRPDALDLLHVAKSHIMDLQKSSPSALFQNRAEEKRHKHKVKASPTSSISPRIDSSAEISLNRALHQLSLPQTTSSREKPVIEKPPAPHPPLHTSRDERKIQILRTAGHNINDPNFDTGAALLWAARHRNDSMVQFILESSSAELPIVKEHRNYTSVRRVVAKRRNGKSPVYYWEAWFGYVPRALREIIGVTADKLES